MYAVHCVLAGLSFMLMHILNVGVGMTFSGGLIDLVLFGVMQGNAKTHWIWVVVVGAVYFVLYYLIFRFMISKFDYKTPGRDDAEEVKLYTRADVNARSAASGSTAPAGDDPVSALIVEVWAAPLICPTWTAAPPACAAPSRTLRWSGRMCSKPPVPPA